MNPPVLEMPTAEKPVFDASSIGDSFRLNLGGAGEGYRNGRIPGFKTVDLREGPNTDIVADVSDLSFLPDACADELYSSNVLEHFPHTQTEKVLSEWCRVLKPGGKLWLSVPDFDACVQIYLKSGLLPWVQYLLWGDQEHPLNYHYINFTLASLSLVASKAGFSDIRRLHSLPYNVRDASEIRDNRHNIRVSLNVECVK